MPSATTPMKAVPRNNLKRDITLRTLEQMAAKTRNWGKWGPDDQLGTLNYVSPQDIVKAAALVRKGIGFRSPESGRTHKSWRRSSSWMSYSKNRPSAEK